VVPLHDALQFWVTILFAFLAFREWDLFAREPAARAGTLASEVRPSPWDVALSVRLGLGAAALLGALLAPILQQASSPGDVVGLAAYGSITFSAGAAVLGALVQRARLALARLMLELDGTFEP
jgi:hypothetical protein